ncbi:hypothetical protein CC80DRAFT_115677 [Byssothecium circinans]|uniref:Uncharacterized protein n=1 Tax=Byssothecium circinans TaxID=147558 RepID=A0A6A5TR78_9PLEO|nr:hypothetical protein CC80DRAFT_115677 [Byssothecium circinans]
MYMYVQPAMYRHVSIHPTFHMLRNLGELQLNPWGITTSAICYACTAYCSSAICLSNRSMNKYERTANGDINVNSLHAHLVVRPSLQYSQIRTNTGTLQSTNARTNRKTRIWSKHAVRTSDWRQENAMK